MRDRAPPASDACSRDPPKAEVSAEILIRRKNRASSYGATRHAFKILWNRVVYCQHHEGFDNPFEFCTDFHRGIPDLKTERARFISKLNASDSALEANHSTNISVFN